MEAVEHTYLYTSIVTDYCNEDEFFVEFYDADGTSKPAAVTKNFDELINFIEQFEEE